MSHQTRKILRTLSLHLLAALFAFTVFAVTYALGVWPGAKPSGESDGSYFYSKIMNVGGVCPNGQAVQYYTSAGKVCK